MQITFNGFTSYGTSMNLAGYAQPNSNVSSVTISGLDSDSFNKMAVGIYWIQPSLFADTLVMRFNGSSVPSGSVMWRSGHNASLGTTENLLESDFVVGSLGLGVANSWMIGDLYWACDRNSPEGYIVTGESFGMDGLLTVGDRVRIHKRSGIWRDRSNNITSITFQTGSGNARIAANSDIRVYI